MDWKAWRGMIGSDPMKDWVQAQIDEGKYASSGDYMRDSIRKAQQEKNKFTALQTAISAGIESGLAGELDIISIKQKARQLAGLENL